MKGWAIALFVLGGINILISLIGLGTQPQYAEQQLNQLFGGIAFVGVGAYLMQRAAKKAKQAQEKQDWIDGKNN